MSSFAWPMRILLLLFSILRLGSATGFSRSHKSDELTYNETFRFITRPDIRAPRWTVEKHHQNRISPGYWFVAPFENLGQKQDDSGHGTVGAHIYDGDGELIWSGVPAFHGRNVLDFRLSNVRGEEMLTLIHQEAGNGVVIDNHYKVSDLVDLGEPDVSSNPHEFFFISNGTRALVTTQHRKYATKAQANGIGRNQCNALWQGFQEIDTATWQPVFVWQSSDHIHLNESTYTDRVADCNNSWGWDYMHINSVDKLPDGDYLVSARHTDAIYKISAQSGSVLWRLGGNQSDFDLGEEAFTRQHNVRFRGQNRTHTFISFLDNARGKDSQKPSRWSSRAVDMALDLANRKATVEHAIEHPEGPGMWAWRRGNYQMLPNGNAFVCWSEQALQSEHAPDGTMVMRAGLVSERLGTYRAYKSAFVGLPITLPDVHSEAYAGINDSTTTLVHVSWNGATEVGAWNLYKTTEANETMILIASRQRDGFETALAFDGFAAYVIVEALDRHGNLLAWSLVTKTYLPPALNAAIAAEVAWLQTVEDDHNVLFAPAGIKSLTRYPLVPFFFGLVCSAMMMVVIVLFLAPQQAESGTTPNYEPLQQSMQGDPGLNESRS